MSSPLAIVEDIQNLCWGLSWQGLILFCLDVFRRTLLLDATSWILCSNSKDSSREMMHFFLLFMYKLQADRLFSDRYSGLELTIEGHERKLNQRKPKCFQQAQLR